MEVPESKTAYRVTNGGASSDLYEDVIAECPAATKVFVIDPTSILSPLANGSTF